MLVGVWGRFACEGVEEGGCAFPDGIGAGRREELFCEVFEGEGFVVIEVEEGEDLRVI